MANGGRAHWEHVYETKAENELSWFQEHPSISLDLIRATGMKPNSAIIDIGGGESRLVDALLDEGFHALTVLDLSETALCGRQSPAWTKIGESNLDRRRCNRLGAIQILRSVARPGGPSFSHGHRRTPGASGARDEAVRPGGHVIIGTFAPDEPGRCSGLSVLRHDAASIGAVLGDKFALVESRREDHVTPAGATQRFQFSLFRRIA